MSKYSLFDRNYINFLNKIEKEHHFSNNEYSLNIVKDKFSQIYSELVGFGFDKMSVEFTFDNTLIFSLNKNNNKYLLQYFLDFEPNDEDDIEIIFSNISSANNNSIETVYSSLNKVLSEALFEKYLLVQGLERVALEMKVDIRNIEESGKNPLMTIGYVDMVVRDVLDKLNSFTLKQKK